ncbi:MAG: transglutaminaseTgpA domain-containing protein [Alphaproteobacteria bacterium]
MNIYFKLSVFIILSQLALMFQKLEYENFLYVLAITITVLSIKYKNIIIHALIRHPSLIILMGIQFVFEDYTITKDFFINCLYILLLFKFLETKKKDYFFFVALSIFVTISNLINNQNLLSSIISGSSAITAIILLYLINQKELITLNIQNLKRIVLISVFTVPIIILTYLFFPRAEVKVSLFANKSNNLGIPDKISLGSFQQITLEDEDVFNAKFFERVNQNQLYFRVKTFEVLDQLKNWRSIDTKVTFKNNQNTVRRSKNQLKYDLILFNHEKNWIPVLDYTVPRAYDFRYDAHNLTYRFNQKMSSKKKFDFYAQSISPVINLSIKEKSYYLQIPNTVDQKLINWSKENKKNKSSLEYAEFLMSHFKNQDYFYNLKPNPIGNNYSKFFFETKEGYCEYYAGTMTLLLRAADIPSRIVTGFYGGRYNNLGDFYTFSQEDAHSWVEIWINNKGWIRFDPTQVIPPNRIKNTINNFEREENDIAIEQNEFIKFFGEKGFNLWVRYLDYQWTNFLINYDSQARSNFIKNIQELNKSTLIDLIENTLWMIGLIFITIFLIIIARKSDYSDLFFLILTKKYKVQFNQYQTHQHIFKQIKNDQKAKEMVANYEYYKFSKNRLNLFNFIKIIFFQSKKLEHNH